MGETRETNSFLLGTFGQHVKSLNILHAAKELYEIRSQRAFHARALHYYFVTETARGRRDIRWPDMGKTFLPDWNPYKNDKKHSDKLSDALKTAVRMGYIPKNWVKNKNCPEWELGLDKWERHQSSLDTVMSSDRAPELGTFNNFRVTTGLFSYEIRANEDFFDEWAADIAKRYAKEAVTFSSFEFDQPFHLVVVCEKSGMDEEILPVCHRFNADYVSFKGNLQYLRITELARYIRSLPVERPIRIFYLADFDSSGVMMPGSLAPDLLWLFPNRDIKLFWTALTYEQVMEFDLPESFERGKKKAQNTKVKNFEKKYDRGATELDALASLHPQALEDILKTALEPYYDRELEESRLEAQKSLQEDVEKAVLDVLQSSREQIINAWKMVLQIKDQARKVYTASGLEGLLDEIDKKTRGVGWKFHRAVGQLGLDETYKFDPRDGEYPDEGQDVLDDMRLKIPEWREKTDSRPAVNSEDIREAFLKISPEMAEWAVQKFLENRETALNSSGDIG